MARLQGVSVPILNSSETVLCDTVYGTRQRVYQCRQGPFSASEESEMQDFSGKIAVVTGGGTGMGRALVR